MSETPMPKRLDYAKVVVLAHLTLIGGCFWDLMLYPASRGVFAFACIMTAIMAIPMSFLLCIWLVIIWLVYGQKRPWRGRTWIALLPCVLILASVVFHALTFSREDSLRRIFRGYFAQEIPADATEVYVSAPTLADSGHKEFTFRCSKESTLALIKALKVEPQKGEPALFSRAVRDGSNERWKDTRCYERVDEKGTQIRLITGSMMESVLITRWPGWAEPARAMSR